MVGQLLKASIVETNNKDQEIFYVREFPVRPGYSYNISATSYEGAEWLMKRIPEYVNGQKSI